MFRQHIGNALVNRHFVRSRRVRNGGVARIGDHVIPSSNTFEIDFYAFDIASGAAFAERCARYAEAVVGVCNHVQLYPLSTSTPWLRRMPFMVGT